MSQLGYGKADVVGSPFDFYTNAALGGITGTLATGSTLQMNNNKLIVYQITSALAALTVTLPLNPQDGAVAEVSNVVGGQTITSLTINANTNDSVVGTAVSATSTAAGVTYSFKYSLNGDVTKGAGPRSWLRTA
jgi:hypothetical protein